ncbi:MAG: galactosyldiacylglycerol synthase [Clostridia bacterium]|nr:galactosyldiacylglycerol synthase [Clostridia bacterium]
MKCLVMSVKAGFGHHSTGQAVMDYLTDKGVECVMLDTFEYINPRLSESISDGYLFSTKYLPDVYGKAYTLLDKREEEYDKLSPVTVVSKLVTRKLKDFVVDYKPDVVIGTHSYACLLMTFLKEKEYICCPTFGIVTDFTVHPFWESTKIDYYVTADALLNNQMNKKGIPTEKILPYGIPIKQKFSTKLDKAEACEKLGIDDKFTVLMMMGSMGFGNISACLEKIDELDTEFQVLCVCGNNKKAKKEIDDHVWKKSVVTYDFIDYIDLLMDASDCIITKPGGLTTSELLAKKLPAILLNPIPGQEDRNLEFLVNSGVAMMSTQTFPVDEALYELMNNKWRMDLIKESVEHIGKPDSTKKLCEFVLEKCQK